MAAKRQNIDLLIGIAIGLAFSASTISLVNRFTSWLGRRKEEDIVDGVPGLIGNTPLLRIKSLSDALGVDILGKAEFLNPGGSVKDRVAMKIIDDAEASGYLKPGIGSRIFEGTVGSTGISIATLAAARGYNTTIIMPDDVAAEKALALRALGADVEKVRPASIVDKKQFVNLAKSKAAAYGTNARSLPGLDGVVSSDQDLDAKDQPRGFFADQFENRSNFEAHYQGTGPEIWRQSGCKVDAFVSGAGTGGTIAGAGQYLREKNPKIIVVLSDPEGSGLYNKVKHGVMFDAKESEGRKRRHQVDTVVEGIGINRLTKNFEYALPIIDDAIRVSDVEAVSMSRFIVKNDACNLVAAVKVAKRLPRSGRVVTILCDSGSRHYSKFWNDEYLEAAGIRVDISLTEDLLKQNTIQSTSK
ncbi:related to cysteine synthase [Serendipita indica DSM 11827]|uniref:cysteine synthase n=1 Tax=Serendipita indica (strain DSM 11827) TaxID=1109443 RepID=G4TTT8_SERID|nr:related to cysteine synthase [Serendipita indica DSM 11827]